MSAVMIEPETGRRYVEKYVTFFPLTDGTIQVMFWDKLDQFMKDSNVHLIKVEVPKSIWDAPTLLTKVEPIKFDTICDYMTCRYKGVPHFHHQGEGGVVVENQMMPTKS